MIVYNKPCEGFLSHQKSSSISICYTCFIISIKWINVLYAGTEKNKCRKQAAHGGQCLPVSLKCVQ